MWCEVCLNAERLKHAAQLQKYLNEKRLVVYVDASCMDEPSYFDGVAGYFLPRTLEDLDFQMKLLRNNVPSEFQNDWVEAGNDRKEKRANLIEIIAAAKAVKIWENSYKSMPLVVYTDNNSMVKQLSDLIYQNVAAHHYPDSLMTLSKLVKDQDPNVKVVYCKAHIGITGNTEADRMARAAS